MDTLSVARRSENMSRIRCRDTAPEMAVRRLVHSMGYRYRLHHPDLPGKPDLVFPALGKVVFVHGCFWHQHASAACPEKRKPKSNQTYWDAKLSRNVTRDKQHVRQLRGMGWKVLAVWECQTANLATLKGRIAAFLER